MLVAKASTILALLVFSMIFFFPGNILIGIVDGGTQPLPHVILDRFPVFTTRIGNRENKMDG